MGLVLDHEPRHFAGGRGHAHIEIQPAVLRHEPRQHSRQRITNEALANGEAHTAGFQSLQVREPALEGLTVGALLTIVFNQQPAGLGEHDGPATMLYQGNPDFRLQLGDLATDGRNGNVELIRRRPHRSQPGRLIQVAHIEVLHIPNHTRFAQIYPGNPRWWRINTLYHFQGFADMLKRTLIVAACAALVSVARADAQPDLMNAYATLASKHFIDLTHSFGVTTPHWKGFGEMKRRTLYTIRKDGFHVEEFCHVGQWGTHVDPPAHFHDGLKTVDQIELKDMLMPLVVLDVHEKVAKNADYVLSVDDVRAWESRHGRIPEHAFVAMRTDWSKRWPNDASMQNEDEKGVAHYPGWSMAVLKLLYEDRHIAASGHETTDTDPGVATTKDDYSLESYVLGTNHYQIEMLANLDQVPEYGALVMVSFPKPDSGSGFPARVIAISP